MSSTKKENLYSNDLIEKLLESRKNTTSNDDEHCLEYAGDINGVTYLNDSKSTRVTRTKHSLESIDAPVLLILGGYDQENDYCILSQMVRDKVKAVFYLGNENDKLLKYFIEEYLLFVKVDSLNEAVKYASNYGAKGEVVLFSPGCPNDKEHDNYKARGNAFKKLVNDLIPSKN